MTCTDVDVIREGPRRSEVLLEGRVVADVGGKAGSGDPGSVFVVFLELVLGGNRRVAVVGEFFIWSIVSLPVGEEVVV